MTEERMKAIKILEFIADKYGKEDMFDGELWYALEDGIVEILETQQIISKKPKHKHRKYVKSCKICMDEVNSRVGYGVEDGRLDSYDAEHMSDEARIVWTKHHDNDYDPY